MKAVNQENVIILLVLLVFRLSLSEIHVYYDDIIIFFSLCSLFSLLLNA